MEQLIALGALTKFPPGGRSDAPEDGRATFSGPRGSVRSRIEAVLQDRMLLTAFQPIRDHSNGEVIGAQALTRFSGDTGDQPADWFAEARDARLGSDLEFAAMESALAAARILSPSTCLDPLLPGFLEESALAPARLVLELTEAMTREQPAALLTALAPLRRSGVRLAIDHAGSYVTSIRHFRQLRPDIIKLDRNLVAGIATDPIHSSLCEAMIGFAEHIGAVVIAQGIETRPELAAATGLGTTTGQGYLLGAPTTRPEDWTGWTPAAQEAQSLTNPDGSLRS
ncbi:EAL domain-containing protein [Arthrobacter sp. NPDC058130]|uniref:EAL domain-containing protein n=1 Tax=Arthrobacter sp. NPDC058130 TaxID=3346353 RepID=UPI0036E989A6